MRLALTVTERIQVKFDGVFYRVPRPSGSSLRSISGGADSYKIPIFVQQPYWFFKHCFNYYWIEFSYYRIRYFNQCFNYYRNRLCKYWFTSYLIGLFEKSFSYKLYLKKTNVFYMALTNKDLFVYKKPEKSKTILPLSMHTRAKMSVKLC